MLFLVFQHNALTFSDSDPSVVKTMLPKLTTRRGGGMRFAAVDTWITVRTSLTAISGGNGAIHLGIALALRTVRAVVFFAMQTTTDRAHNMGKDTRCLWVTPSTTMCTKRNINMESGSTNYAWQAFNKEGVPSEGLGSGPGLRIPDVKVNGA